ncbi:hypothetical protein G6038_24985 [Rhodococcus sp. 14C212]|uniref:hypothetical protein n=1 Tax=Rhodococcus sp. 14C212 TaxID=2711209 RepID=UPI0013EB8427|nr:hypothetical protein [Rhodococcus sp. 14C212]NGP08665.1 hypothetical protein [Rhodococcus sp. 14C212]
MSPQIKIILAPNISTTESISLLILETGGESVTSYSVRVFKRTSQNIVASYSGNVSATLQESPSGRR